MSCDGAVNVLSPEERFVELFGLGQREPRLGERFHHFIRDLPLLRGEMRRVAIVPVQTSADVLVDSRRFARDLVCESVQLLYLLEQRLEPLVVHRAFFVDQVVDVVADVPSEVLDVKASPGAIGATAVLDMQRKARVALLL